MTSRLTIELKQSRQCGITTKIHKQINNIEQTGPEIDQHFYKQLIFDEDIKIIQ